MNTAGERARHCSFPKRVPSQTGQKGGGKEGDGYLGVETDVGCLKRDCILMKLSWQHEWTKRVKGKDLDGGKKVENFVAVSKRTVEEIRRLRGDRQQRRRPE